MRNQKHTTTKDNTREKREITQENREVRLEEEEKPRARKEFQNTKHS